jgi:hypothetical protein
VISSKKDVGLEKFLYGKPIGLPEETIAKLKECNLYLKKHPENYGGEPLKADEKDVEAVGKWIKDHHEEFITVWRKINKG